MEHTSEEMYTRQWDIVTPEELNVPISIVGVGGIGSWTALLLAKMGCRDLTLYDFDTVELHNLAYQFYGEGDIGREKVQSLADHISDFVSDQKTLVYPIGEKFGIRTTVASKYLIIGVDSMLARHDIADIIEKDTTTYTVIDGRMGGNQVEVYVTNNKDYRSTLVKPGEEDQDPCSARSVVYNTAFIGSVICNTVKKLVKKQSVPSRLLFDLHNWNLIKQ